MGVADATFECRIEEWLYLTEVHYEEKVGSVTRVRNASIDGLDVRLQEEAEGPDVPESIGYLVVER